MRKKKIVLVILFVLVFLQVFPLISVSADSVLAQEGPSVTSVEEAPSKAVFAAPRLKPGDYPQLGWVKSREAVWVAAQVHLFFGAFVLAVPIFVLTLQKSIVLILFINPIFSSFSLYFASGILLDANWGLRLNLS